MLNKHVLILNCKLSRNIHDSVFYNFFNYYFYSFKFILQYKVSLTLTLFCLQLVKKKTR